MIGGDEYKHDGKTSREGAVVYQRLVDVVHTNTPEEVRDIFGVRIATMGRAEAFEQLTEVYQGLSLVMHAIKRGSLPMFEVVFEAMLTALDGDQLARVFARGNPRGNSPLLLLAAEGDSQDLFDAVLGTLDRVAKVAKVVDQNDTRQLDPTEHSGGRGVPRRLAIEAEDLTLLQAIYGGRNSAVQAWIKRSGSSTQRTMEFIQFHAGRSPVMHAALVGSPKVVSEILGYMREATDLSEGIESALENRTSKSSLLLSAAHGGSEEVFKEVMQLEARTKGAQEYGKSHSQEANSLLNSRPMFRLYTGKRLRRVKLLEMFMEGREYGRNVLMDAAMNGGAASFRAVVEILDKRMDEDQAIIMLRDSTFDGSSDADLCSCFTPNRHAVAARVAALSTVLSMDQMADISTACLETELDGMDKTSTLRDLLQDFWPGRLSFLLACGAKVTTGADGHVDDISDSLGLVELKKCFRQAISAVENPFIPGMMLSLALVIEAPTAKADERRKLTELREMVEELLLEVLERMPQTVLGFPGGAAACSLLFEPENTGTRSESFKGPLKTAFSKHHLITTFCTQPLIVDFISHTFGAGLLNLRSRIPSVAAGMLKKVDPAVVVRDPLAADLQRNRTTLFPGAQFIFVGIVAMPFTYYRVPLLRMWLDLAVFVIFLAVYTIVVANMYDKSSANAPEIALGFYVIAAIMAEAGAVGRSNREYLRDSWNWLDVPAIFLLSAGFVVRIWTTLSGNDTEQVGEACYLLGAPLLFPRILFFAQIHPSQGALLQVMMRMVSKVLQFSIIMIVVMMGFVVSFWASSERYRIVNEDESATFDLMWVAVFKAMLGDFGDVESLTEEPDWVDRLLFVFYLIVMTIMLLNLLIAILSTAHANIEERAETEIKASKVRTMEHYRRVVVNNVLPAPLNLLQLLALFPILVIDLCIHRGLYDRLKPTIARIMGSFVFWATLSPVAIALSSLLWFVSTPTIIISRWDQNASLWGNVSRSVAAVFESLIAVPLTLFWLWALGVVNGARQIVDLAQGRRLEIPTSVSFLSNMPQVPTTVGEILMTEGRLSVHELSACLEDPMSDPEVRRDEENRPTTVQHIKLLRNRLEATRADHLVDIMAHIESAANAREGRLENIMSAAIASAVNERVDALEKCTQNKLDDILMKLKTL